MWQQCNIIGQGKPLLRYSYHNKRGYLSTIYWAVAKLHVRLGVWHFASIEIFEVSSENGEDQNRKTGSRFRGARYKPKDEVIENCKI